MSINLVANFIEIGTGTIVVSAVANDAPASGVGNIKDLNNTIVATFEATPFTFNTAVVGATYTVTCGVLGYAIQTKPVTVQETSTPVDFTFVKTYTAELSIILAGLGAFGLWLMGRKKK